MAVLIQSCCILSVVIHGIFIKVRVFFCANRECSWYTKSVVSMLQPWLYFATGENLIYKEMGEIF